MVFNLILKYPMMPAVIMSGMRFGIREKNDHAERSEEVTHTESNQQECQQQTVGQPFDDVLISFEKKLR
jgi:hypothetical protein